MTKRTIAVTGILTALLLAGCMRPVTAAASPGPTRVSEGQELTVTKMDDTTTYNTNLYITKNLDLNGQIMRVNGDLTIGSSVNLNKGLLIVNGNVLHTAGRVTFNKGTIQVSGDYRIQDRKVTADGGYEYISSEGTLLMDKGEDCLKVGRDLVIQSSGGNQNGYNYYTGGTIEVGGDFYQKNGNGSNFCASNSHKVILTGTKPTVAMESGYASFQNLEVTSGVMACGGNLGIKRLDSDLTIEVPAGSELALCGRLNGRRMTVEGDVCLPNGMELEAGQLIVNGNVLHTAGRVTFAKGTIQVSGDYRIQDRKVTADGGYEYIDSEGTLLMDKGEDCLKVGRDLVIQSSGGNQNGYNYYTGGTIEVGGDFYQKNGSGSNFRASNSHKVILNGTKPQNVVMESERAGFCILELTQPISNYTFQRDPCWNTLITQAVPVDGVALDKTNVSVKAGSSTTLTATVAPENAADKTVTWNSSNTSVAAVDGNGNVTGVSAGTATITVTTKDGAKTAACTVTVTEDSSQKVSTGGETVRITNAADKEVAYSAPKSKTATSVKIPETVNVGGEIYTVTSIDDRAFYKCTAMTNVTIGTNVTEIGKFAFSGCSKLKTVTIKSTKLKKVRRGAFKGISKSAVIKVPGSRLSSYKKLLKGKYPSGVKIKKL